MFVLRYPGFAGSAEVVRGFPLPPGETKHSGGVYRYHSSDGKHWQPWEQLGLSTRDSILVHQLPDGTYRTFYKGVAPVPPGGLVPYDVSVGECRIIVVRTSEDGTNWSGYEPVITPDWMDPQDTQFMRVSCEYGRLKYRLFEQIWKIQLIVQAKDVDPTRDIDLRSLDSAIKSYDEAWAEWKDYQQSHPLCPTIYKNVAHFNALGIGAAVNRYRSLIGVGSATRP